MRELREALAAVMETSIWQVGDDDAGTHIQKDILSMRWTVEVTVAAERELLALPSDLRAHFLHVAEMLEEVGPHKVGMPLVRPIEQKLWEMRLKGKDGIARAIYFAITGRRLVVVRFFLKKVQTTPRREIEIALKRMVELER